MHVPDNIFIGRVNIASGLGMGLETELRRACSEVTGNKGNNIAHDRLCMMESVCSTYRAVLFKNISGGLRNEAIAAHEFVESGYSVFCSHLVG